MWLEGSRGAGCRGARMQFWTKARAPQDITSYATSTQMHRPGPEQSHRQIKGDTSRVVMASEQAVDAHPTQEESALDSCLLHTGLEGEPWCRPQGGHRPRKLPLSAGLDSSHPTRACQNPTRRPASLPCPQRRQGSFSVGPHFPPASAFRVRDYPSLLCTLCSSFLPSLSLPGPTPSPITLQPQA